MASRERADVLLVQRGLAETRTKAQALLIAGQVFSGEVKVDKPGTMLREDAPLEVRGRDPYVSRGGHKLAGALDAFSIDPADLVCADVGASTGGFTDCLLQRGARRVYAIDVGEGLLHEKLRTDARVAVRDRENARDLRAASFPEPIDLVVVDASFIGLSSLLPALADVARPGGRLLALVKPQFEVGRDVAKRGRGVVRDDAVRKAAIDRVTDEIAASGFRVLGAADSVLRGPKGNLEHFVLAERVPG